MLDKPYDLAVMFGIFALIVITVGFGVTNINTFTNSTHDESFFTNVENNVTSAKGLKGASDSSGTGLAGEVGSSETITQDSFIAKGFQSLLTLGQTWNLVESSMDEATDTLGINPIYITIITSILLIAFAVTLYTWLRGN